jgi:Flp pilus assembly protein TadG
MNVRSARPGGGRVGDDRGQAAVELAMVIPIAVVIAFALVEVGVAIRNELAVELAAREGARAAAVSRAPEAAATNAARRAVALPIDVTTASDGTTVTVTASYEHRPGGPLGRLIGVVGHDASVTMVLEPP